MESVEVRSRSFIIKWITIPDKFNLKWQVQPVKKSINFGLFRRIPNLDNKNGTLLSEFSTVALLSPEKNPDNVEYPYSNDISTSKQEGSTIKSAKAQLAKIGCEPIYWCEKCSSKDRLKGTYSPPSSSAREIAVVFDNTFSKSTSKEILFSYAFGTLSSLNDPTSPSHSDSLTAHDQSQSQITNNSSADISSNSKNIKQNITSPLISNDGVFSGPLLKKRRKKLQGYATRYFTLDYETGILNYYLNSKSPTLRGSITIPFSSVSAKKSNREFYIDSGTEIWRLRATSNPEWDLWLKAFRRAKEVYAKSASTASSNYNTNKDTSSFSVPTNTTVKQRDSSVSLPTISTNCSENMSNFKNHFNSQQALDKKLYNISEIGSNIRASTAVSNYSSANGSQLNINSRENINVNNLEKFAERLGELRNTYEMIKLKKSINNSQPKINFERRTSSSYSSSPKTTGSPMLSKPPIEDTCPDSNKNCQDNIKSTEVSSNSLHKTSTNNSLAPHQNPPQILRRRSSFWRSISRRKSQTQGLGLNINNSKNDSDPDNGFSALYSEPSNNDDYNSNYDDLFYNQLEKLYIDFNDFIISIKDNNENLSTNKNEVSFKNQDNENSCKENELSSLSFFNDKSLSHLKNHISERDSFISIGSDIEYFDASEEMDNAASHVDSSLISNKFLSVNPSSFESSQQKHSYKNKRSHNLSVPTSTDQGETQSYENNIQSDDNITSLVLLPDDASFCTSEVIVDDTASVLSRSSGNIYIDSEENFDSELNSKISAHSVSSVSIGGAENEEDNEDDQEKEVMLTGIQKLCVRSFSNDLFPLSELKVGKLFNRRITLPASLVSPPSLIQFFRKNVGKDLSSISMPVSANEPINLLQRFSEYLEYSNLLDKAAAASPFSYARLIYVTCFAISSLSNLRSKARVLRKPYNPLLGETYELVREDKGFRLLAEKVSHRPPIMALHAEGRAGWSFVRSSCPSQKFWGKSIELINEGKSFVSFKKINNSSTPSSKNSDESDSGTDNVEDTYYWNPPTTYLRNLIAGEKYIEPEGSFTIYCGNTGAHIDVEFKAGGVFSGRSEILTAHGEDGQGNALPFTLKGKWTEALFFENKSSSRSNKTNKEKDVPDEGELWHVGSLVKDADSHYGFTTFTAALNEIGPMETYNPPFPPLSKDKTSCNEKSELVIAPTDARLRPDQRMLEDGKIDDAENLKLKLESDQRERRKDLEEKGDSYTPKWFDCDNYGFDDDKVYILKRGKDNYWNRRKNHDWSDVQKLW